MPGIRTFHLSKGDKFIQEDARMPLDVRFKLGYDLPRLEFPSYTIKHGLPASQPCVPDQLMEQFPIAGLTVVNQMPAPNASCYIQGYIERLPGSQASIPVGLWYRLSDVSTTVTPEFVFPLAPHLGAELVFDFKPDSPLRRFLPASARGVVGVETHVLVGSLGPNLESHAHMDGFLQPSWGGEESIGGMPVSYDQDFEYDSGYNTTEVDVPDEPILVPTDGREIPEVKSILLRTPNRLPFVALMPKISGGIEFKIYDQIGRVGGTEVPRYLGPDTRTIETLAEFNSEGSLTWAFSLFLLDEARALREAFGVSQRFLRREDREIRQLLGMQGANHADLQQAIRKRFGLKDDKDLVWSFAALLLSENDELRARFRISEQTYAEIETVVREALGLADSGRATVQFVIRAKLQVEAPQMDLHALVEHLELAFRVKKNPELAKWARAVCHPGIERAEKLGDSVAERAVSSVPIPEVLAAERQAAAFARYKLAEVLGERDGWMWVDYDSESAARIAPERSEIWARAEFGVALPLFVGFRFSQMDERGIDIAPYTSIPYVDTDEIRLRPTLIPGHPLLSVGGSIFLRNNINPEPVAFTTARDRHFSETKKPKRPPNLALSAQILVDPFAIRQVPGVMIGIIRVFGVEM